MSGLADRLKNVEGSSQVNVEVNLGIAYRGSDRHLRGEMINLVRIAYGVLYFSALAYVTHRDLQPPRFAGAFLQGLEVVPDTPPRKIVEYVNARIGILQQPAGPVRANKSCSAKYQYRSLCVELFHRIHRAPLRG